MADLGLEPQSVHVTAFHAAKLAPSLKIGEKEDLDVRDRRVAVLGLEEFSERQSEFDFDATHGSDARRRGYAGGGAAAHAGDGRRHQLPIARARAGTRSRSSCTGRTRARANGMA